MDSGTVSAAPTTDSAWTATESGVGPVRVGMRVEDLRAALGGELRAPPALDPACDYVFPAEREGISIMLVEGRVARVDGDTSTIATAEGARVGESAEHIQRIYAGRIRTEPHKYTAGQYLIVTPTELADSALRLLFETSPEGRVVRYRVGRLPEVSWVEGCS